MENSGTNSNSENMAAPVAKRQSNRWILPVVVLVILAVGSPYGLRWYHGFKNTATTDNATIQGSVVNISSRISGTVIGVEVTDNQRVSAGDVLVRFDRSDLEMALEQAGANLELMTRQAEVARISVDQAATQAEAQGTQASGGTSLAFTSIEVARAAVESARIAVSSSEADLEEAQVKRDQAFQDYQRAIALADEGVIARQELDHSESNYQVAESTLASAHNDVTLAQTRLQQAELNVDIAEAQRVQSVGAVQNAEAGAVQTDVRWKQYEAALAQVDVAQVAVDAAELQLSYTTITAPSDGRLGEVSVEVGQRVSPSQPLIALVLDEVWVVANFKETQVDRIRPGLPVGIRVDAFPGRIFEGHVDSLSPASGATFALLPPENATGNFTKVVQRIPVKIVFEPDSIAGYEDLLEPGMSVVVRVDISSENDR